MKQGIRQFHITAVLTSIMLAAGAFAADPARQPQQEPVLEARGDRPTGPSIDDPTIDGKSMHVRPELASAVRPGMPFDLPSALLTPGGDVTLAARSGKRLLVGETITLPATLQEEVTAAFLSNHATELRKLRTLATSRPDLVQFTVSIGGRMVIEMPFAEADSGSASAADGANIVGSSRTVAVNLKDPSKLGSNGLYPDPECESACNDAFLECDLNCDHRGSCTYCNEQYDDCVFYCPKLCSEPKQVYEYGTSWQYAYSIGEYICIANWNRYILWSNYEQRNVYERTVHCDDSYTDVFKRTETRFDDMCKTFDSYGCIGNMYPPPPNC